MAVRRGTARRALARNPGDEPHFHAGEQGMEFYAPRRQRLPPEREFFYEISIKFFDEIL